MQWGFPESVSTFGSEIDSIYTLILYVTGAMFVIVEAALIYFVVRYRRREERKAEYIEGHRGAEILWTAVPFLLVGLLAFRSADTWLDVKGADTVPPDALEIAVAASQFEWNVTYPGPDGRLGTDDDIADRNELNIPVDRPVRVTLTAEDVIHSFFLPEFRVKQDAVPGMETHVWFEATRTGDYVLGCAELCGLGHYRMRGTVTVHEPDAFERWQQEESAAS
ncbi:MAG: cytochrome c oxidase subunit II [Gemmatimonadota bacterium]